MLGWGEVGGFNDRPSGEWGEVLQCKVQGALGYNGRGRHVQFGLLLGGHHPLDLHRMRRETVSLLIIMNAWF